ncbi:MAG: ATP-binding protein [Aestuariibacter sp.]
MGNEGAVSNRQIESLNSRDTINSYADAYLNDLVEQIIQVCGVPTCLITLVDEERQWVIAGTELPFSDIPRALSLCNETLQHDGVIEVSNLCKHAELDDNPMVSGEPKIRFYAGHALLGVNGQAIGTLCVMDQRSQRLTAAQQHFFITMANVISLYLKNKSDTCNQAIGSQIQQLLINNFDDHIFAKDEHHRIIFANPAFMKLQRNKSLSDVLGSTLVEKYTEKDARSFLAQDDEAFEKGKSEAFETILTPDGVKRVMLTRKTRFIGTDGRPCILCISRDVSELEGTNKKLKQSYQELDSFAYIASHDLKAPLNGVEKICSWIEEDLQESITPDVAEHFTLLKGRINRMRGLLDDLLEYSRVARIANDQHEINLVEKVCEITDLLNIDNFNVSADTCTLHIHKIPFEMVLRNLIQNAVKHHHKGNGEVHISVEENAHHYVINVDDDGPGIEAQYREKAKQIFQTLKPRDVVEGSGLGLAIVTKSIESLGGTLDILDSPLGGARIQLTWPKCKDSEVTYGM